MTECRRKSRFLVGGGSHSGSLCEQRTKLRLACTLKCSRVDRDVALRRLCAGDARMNAQHVCASRESDVPVPSAPAQSSRAILLHEQQHSLNRANPRGCRLRRDTRAWVSVRGRRLRARGECLAQHGITTKKRQIAALHVFPRAPYVHPDRVAKSSAQLRVAHPQEDCRSNELQLRLVRQLPLCQRD